MKLTYPVPISSFRFGYCSMSFIHITLYCSELGYNVCIMISEVKVCTTSVLKCGVSRPVEIPSIVCAENCAGNWKSICQSELDCLGAHSFIVSFYIHVR